MKDLPGTRYRNPGNGITWEIIGDGNIVCVKEPSNVNLPNWKIGDITEGDGDWDGDWIRTEPKERLFDSLYERMTHTS